MSIRLETPRKGIVRLVVDRPQTRNALDWQSIAQFSAAVEQLWETTDIRCLIVTGAGQSFIAGGDLKVLHNFNQYENGQRLSQEMTSALNRLEALPFPVIAAINGPARGGGAEIALACDLRLMAESADLGFVQIQLGLIPGWGAGQRLLRLVGYGRALEYLATGAVLSPAQALAAGLVNRLTTAETIQAEAIALAEQIASFDPQAVAAIKAFLVAGTQLPAASAASFEQSLFAPLWAAEAHHQAVEKFLHRKKDSSR